MQKYTTDSMHLAATLLVFGYESEVEMVSDRKAKFLLDGSAMLEEIVRRFWLNDEEGLQVNPQDLFTAWSVMRSKVLEAQRLARK